MADDFINKLISIERFRSGREAQQQSMALQQQQAQRQQRISDAEYQRFLDANNLKSMVKGALEFRTITNPAKQEEFLNKRIAEIQARGGDPRDSQELLAMKDPKQRMEAVNNVINIGERFGVIKRDPNDAAQYKFTKPFAAVETQTGKDVFVQRDPLSGELSTVPGYAPPPKSSETIEMTKDGVVIRRGAGQNALMPTRATQNMLQKKLTSGVQTIESLNRIGELYEDDFLTLYGRAKDRGLSVWSYLGGELSKEGKDFKTKRQAFISRIRRMFDRYRQDITGAAASVAELRRLEQSLINSADSPADFRAKYDEFKTELLKNNRIMRKLLREGFDPKDKKEFGSKFDEVRLSGQDDDPRLRIQEIRQELLKQNPAMDEATQKQRIVEQLRQEGYR